MIIGLFSTDPNFNNIVLSAFMNKYMATTSLFSR